MKKIPASIIKFKYFIAIIVSLFFLGTQPVKFAEDKTFFHGYLIEKPIIRIGLGVNLGEIKISSSSGMKIYEVKENYKLISEDTVEVLIKGHKEKLMEKYVVLVANVNDPAEAETLAQEIRFKINEKTYVFQGSEEGVGSVLQVRVGDFLTRGDALNCIKRLNESGYRDNWIIREEITENESKPLWILVDDRLKSLNQDTILYFIPDSPQSYLSYKGRDYRGIFILKASRKGIVLINVLNIEDYLKAVVPSEFSPYQFNRIEAQKAQAVAARTYAMKNLNSYQELGYDLCDTPRSQFYKGLNAEHPLSSTAVDETQGEVALYNGKFIDALYTSTCGGMTENVEEVFQGPSLPYLRSTECVYEKQKEWLFQSSRLVHPIYIKGRNISSQVVSLISKKIMTPQLDPVFYQEKASVGESRLLLENVRKYLGSETRETNLEISSLDYFSLAKMIVHYLGWEGRVKHLLLEKEKDFLLKDLGDILTEEKDSLAYLIQEGIFPLFDNMKDLQQELSRGELAFCIWNVIQNERDVENSGKFISLTDDKIEVEGAEQDLVLDPNLFLAKNVGGISTFVSHLTLLGGETIRWIETDNVIQMLEVVYPVQSYTLDRSSAYHSWRIRISREDLEKRINRYYPVGKLINLESQRRGQSQRIIELNVIGLEGQVVVKGLRIRRVLGLKETLFVIGREYDQEKEISHFTFTGRGWGHGVGLCQVGAYGMALSGADYIKILKKYYYGIKIGKIY